MRRHCRHPNLWTARSETHARLAQLCNESGEILASSSLKLRISMADSFWRIPTHDACCQTAPGACGVCQGERCDREEYEGEQMRRQCEQRKSWCLMGQQETFDAAKCKVAHLQPDLYVPRPRLQDWSALLGMCIRNCRLLLAVPITLRSDHNLNPDQRPFCQLIRLSTLCIAGKLSEGIRDYVLGAQLGLTEQSTRRARPLALYKPDGYSRPVSGAGCSINQAIRPGVSDFLAVKARFFLPVQTQLLSNQPSCSRQSK